MENVLSTHKTIDVLLGILVMGTVGTLIGYLMGGAYFPVALGLGILLGAGVGVFGGRRFFASILVGAILGALLAWFLGGKDAVTVGSASGAAMGGFLGIWISMIMDLIAQRKDQLVPSPAGTEPPTTNSP